MPKDASDNRNIVHEAVEKAWANATTTDEATKALLKIMKRDAAVREALLAPWEWRAAYEAAGRFRRNWRLAIRAAANRATAHKPGQPQTSPRALVRAMMDYALPNGMALRDATREDLHAAVEAHRALVTPMLHDMKWWQRVAKALPEGKTVGESLDEMALLLMWEEIRNG